MAENKILTVTQANELIKMLLEASPLLRSLTVKGEVSNLTVHRSGHLYFSLKDEGGVMSAVMFKGAAQKLKFALEAGLRVLAKGRITVYEKAGGYQLVCEDIIPDGIGALGLAFEQSKKKLAAEGLFDEARKRAIPKCPRTVGVITSPTGAAIRDIINVSARRFPFAKIVLYPALVQGEGAAKQLVQGLLRMGYEVKPDVIIIGRGGGSAEDLWCFNDETLVREVAACPIPVISAVGHEIDFTLCDFAADKRAPTPSAAAEIALPDTSEMLRKFGNVQTKLDMALNSKVSALKEKLQMLATSSAMTRPQVLIVERQKEVFRLEEGMEKAMQTRLAASALMLSKQAALLDAISPLRVLSRGYAMVSGEGGEGKRSIRDLTAGERVVLRLQDGTARAMVESIEERGGAIDGKDE